MEVVIIGSVVIYNDPDEIRSDGLRYIVADGTQVYYNAHGSRYIFDDGSYVVYDSDCNVVYERNI